jgi:hypothetical protein
MRYIFIAGCLFLLLTACSSVRTFTVEIQEPAAITSPVKTQNVVVLNNAAPQPSNQGVFRKYRQVDYSAHPVELDTMSWVAVYRIADILSESGFFENVEVYTQPIREDNNFLAQNNLSEDVITDFLTDLDYDMIVSIDRLALLIEESVQPVVRGSEKGIKNVNMRVQGLLSCGAYIKNRPVPLTTFTIADSLVYGLYFEGDSIEVFKSFPESMAEALTGLLADETASKFMPSWIETERVLYTSGSARMKEANSYANTGNWNEATALWKSLLEKKNKAIDKARLSSNLAVAYEMKENFPEALQRAEQSQTYFKEAESSTSQEESEWIQSYISVLKKRIADNKILDRQWGIAE